ncbi:hypothetical protein [Nocardia vaccinii]|uniref:hypothetical protein n=1 Tax=Nocardia vaccinii TaxID=1822 RepID=UPI000831CE37|nr:hypothetical protein [Nocardia vaccinii]
MSKNREFRDQRPRRRVWLMVAIVGGVIVIGLIAWTVSGGRTSSLSSVGGVRSSSIPTSSTTRPTQQAPAGLEWKLVNGVRLPFSASDGPTGMDGPQPIGFSDTPQGAVLAAWQLSTRLLTDPDTEDLLSRVHAPLDVQQQIRGDIAQVRQFSADQLAAAFAPPVAYRFDYWAPTFAAIYFAVPSSQGGYDFQARAVVWTQDGWQYQPQSGLDPLPNSTSLSGFTPLQ